MAETMIPMPGMEVEISVQGMQASRFEAIEAAEAARSTAETERENAERARANAEQARVNAESVRNAAESGRKAAEEAREQNEAARAEAETLRALAETGRAASEAARAAAESARASAEQVRADAEAERAAAEAVRQETFDRNEVCRQETFEAAENDRATAEAARESAEAARQAAFETNEANREAAFDAAEAARASAETARAEAENARVTAETERVEAENARAQTFSGYQGEIDGLKDDLATEQTAREEADNAMRADLTANANADAVTKRSLDALWKLNQGISYQFETDDTEAYSKTVPSGAKAASVETIGGHTESIDGELVSAVVESVVDRGQNLFDKSTAIQNKYITPSGAIISRENFYLSDYISCRDFTDVSINKGGGIVWYGDDGSVLGFVGGKSTAIFRTYTKPSGAVKFQFDMPGLLLDDLSTVMCVAGVYTEITIPSFTPYKKPTTYTIPAAVRILPGYGWSAGEVCNAIDRTGKGWQYVQRVGSRPYQEGDIVTDGVTTYYALDNPVITDITDLMNGLLDAIPVEAGGTLTFENAAQLAVPNSVEYAVALAEVNG